MPRASSSGANTFALTYGARNVDGDARRTWSAQRQIIRCAAAILTLRGRAAWAHDYNPDRSIAATFQTLPGASFVVNGAGAGARCGPDHGFG